MRQPIQCVLLLSTAILASVGDLRAGVISGTVTPLKADSVVYVNAIPGQEFPVPAKPFVMDRKATLFMPHVLVVPLGATVQFLNQDTVRLNVFWPNISGEHKLSHNPGTLRAGGVDSLRFSFDTPGVVPIRCNVHPDMSGYVIVSPTPYYAVTDASGNFKIIGLPDGSYTISAWREGMKIQSKPVTLSGNA